MQFFAIATLFAAAAMAAPTNQPSTDKPAALNVYKDAKGIFHWGTGPVAAQNYNCQPHQAAGLANLLQCVVNVAPVVAPVVIPVVTVQPEILSHN